MKFNDLPSPLLNLLLSSALCFARICQGQFDVLILLETCREGHEQEQQHLYIFRLRREKQTFLVPAQKIRRKETSSFCVHIIAVTSRLTYDDLLGLPNASYSSDVKLS
ncbi:unnamed protein product [Urochloa humidicola]